MHSSKLALVLAGSVFGLLGLTGPPAIAAAHDLTSPDAAVATYGPRRTGTVTQAKPIATAGFKEHCVPIPNGGVHAPGVVDVESEYCYIEFPEPDDPESVPEFYEPDDD